MTVAHLDRRLLAIMAADVVGYSRLMEIDEPGTIVRLRAVRTEIADPLIAEHRGRIVKLMGDGALLVFESVVDAVGCAIAVQKGIATRNAELPAAERIVFRIGVNLGDVVLVDGDVYGDSVNVAARLEQACDPGGVMISGTAFDHMQGKLDLPLDPAGELRVKNLVRPVRAYRVRNDRRIVGRRRWIAARRGAIVAALLVIVAATAVGAWLLVRINGSLEPSVGSGPEHSLAVLPFTDMSGNPALDYFSDGLTADLTTQLSRTPELHVTGRNSAFI